MEFICCKYTEHMQICATELIFKHYTEVFLDDYLSERWRIEQHSIPNKIPIKFHDLSKH